MKKQFFIKYQLPILFILLIALPGISEIIGLKKFPRKDENRRFNDSINFDFQKLGNFPNDFENFANDNFYFRSPFLNFFHRMKFSVFNISPHPDQSIIGKDGWYFRAGRELKILSGKSDFTKAQLDSFTVEWKKRITYFKQKNIPVVWIIAPLKQYVYSDKLPYNVHRSKTNRITILTKHLEKDFPNLIINPLEKLKQNKDKADLYFKLDNHWNTHAGYLTTQLLIKRLRVEFPKKDIIDIPPFHWEGKTIQSGIHYKVLGIDELSEYAEKPIMNHPQSKVGKKYGYKVIDGFPYPWAYENRYINDSLKNGLRVLFIRDSFGEAMEPFCREVFKESEFIFDAWQFKMNKPIIEDYKPDVVVFIGLGKNVKDFIRHHNKEEHQ